jgi:RNA polymerase sigma factor (sigma-70 family)
MRFCTTRAEGEGNMSAIGINAFSLSVSDEVLLGVVNGVPSAIEKFAAAFHRIPSCTRYVHQFHDLLADLLSALSTTSGRVRLSSIKKPRNYLWAALRRRAIVANAAAERAPSTLDHIIEERADETALDPLETLARSEESERLRQRIQSLGPKEREVMVALLGGATYPEIASKIHRARGQPFTLPALRKIASRASTKLAAMLVVSNSSPPSES